MIVENLFRETIFPNLKEYVESNSNALVSKKKLDSYPLVVVKLLPIMNQYESLDYKEEIYAFGIGIQIYSEENVNDITNLVIDYFKNHFRVSIRIELDVSEELSQNNIRITGKMKNNMIYPFEDYQE